MTARMDPPLIMLAGVRTCSPAMLDGLLGDEQVVPTARLSSCAVKQLSPV